MIKFKYTKIYEYKIKKVIPIIKYRSLYKRKY